MSSLFGSISISLRALLAQQAALQTTSDNIGNINTAGYARRRAVMVEDDPVFDGRLIVGNGVHVQTVESLRDRILELRMHEETQQQGELQAFSGAMKQVEIGFSDVESGLGAQFDTFFASLTRLSTDPSNIPLRQNVLTAAENLAAAFRNASRDLHSIQQSLDLGVEQGATDANALTSQIAELNAKVSQAERLGGDPSTFEDQRTQLIRQLSAVIDVSVIEGDDGFTLTAANGAALVVGNTSFALETNLDSSGYRHIFSNGSDLTEQISGGRIGGLLRARDQAIPSVLADINRLASSFAASVNQAHAAGFDLNGDPGGKVFSDPTELDAAANLTVLLSDPAKLAASANGSVGDNGTAIALQSLQSSAIVGGQNVVDFYSSMVARLGNDIANADSEQEAGDLILRQLANQRASISGVSLDEEAANLIRYQRAFEAAARVVSVIDELTQTVINLGRN